MSVRAGAEIFSIKETRYKYIIKEKYSICDPNCKLEILIWSYDILTYWGKNVCICMCVCKYIYIYSPPLTGERQTRRPHQGGGLPSSHKGTSDCRETAGCTGGAGHGQAGRNHSATAAKREGGLLRYRAGLRSQSKEAPAVHRRENVTVITRKQNGQ